MIDAELGFGFTIWTEKEQNAGEDSPPLLEEANGTTLIGVFDGLGGAGGRRYEVGDHSRTGAFLASRTAAITVRKVFASGALEPELASQDTGLLESALKSNLQRVAGQLGASESRVRSRMKRELPTTMAIASVRARVSDIAETEVDLGVWWAGDSRVYALRPDIGLVALTTDHVVGGGDAMENLSADAPLENCLSADREFRIEGATYTCSTPVALIAATDGCFGYVATPMHFENLILSSLSQAKDPNDWAALLEDRVTSVAADDAALSVVVLGATFDEFQRLVQDRRKYINRTWIVPIENALAERKAAKVELRRLEEAYADVVTDSWGTYTHQYGSLMQQRHATDAEEAIDEEG